MIEIEIQRNLVIGQQSKFNHKIMIKKQIWFDDVILTAFFASSGEKTIVT